MFFKKYISVALAILLSSTTVIFAQTPFPCDNTLYVSRETTLYRYTGNSFTALFEVGEVNALAFSPDGFIWAYDQSTLDIVTFDATGQRTVIPRPEGLPANRNAPFNTGTIDANGYYYIYHGGSSTRPEPSVRFYIIDTNPNRSTYGRLVDPTAGVFPYPEDTRSMRGTPIGPYNSNRRDISDWTINPVNGRLYALTNKGSFRPFHLVSYDPVTGDINDHGEVTGGGIQGGNTVGFGAIFIDVNGDVYVYNNQQGYLYKIVGNTATRVSSVSLPSSNNVDGAMCVNAGIPLPVRLINFEVTKNENSAILTWTTAGEIRNKGFEIEHSTDAISWSPLGFVDSHAENGRSEAGHVYSFTHSSPSHGPNYYRLKQIDLDGTFDVSLIRVMAFGEENAGKIIISPNPTNRLLRISELIGNESIHIYDSSGKRVKSVTSVSSTTDVSLEGLKAGIYHVQIIGQNGGVSSHKVVKDY